MIPRIAFLFAILAFLAGLTVATFAELRIFLPAILKGAIVTVEIAMLSMIVFFAMAFVAGVARAEGNTPIRWLAICYIELFRGTSLLVILFWLFFVLPEFGVLISPTVAAVLGIGLNFGAYGAEVVRGAVQAVPRGQSEATIALNISRPKRLIRIILPQAIPVTIPGLTNLAIELIKATALVSVVTLTDITFASVQQNQMHFRTVEIFTITVMLYYCLAQFVRLGGGALEDHFSRHMQRRPG